MLGDGLGNGNWYDDDVSLEPRSKRKDNCSRRRSARAIITCKYWFGVADLGWTDRAAWQDIKSHPSLSTLVLSSNSVCHYDKYIPN
jgi:hypothetical protein